METDLQVRESTTEYHLHTKLLTLTDSVLVFENTVVSLGSSLSLTCEKSSMPHSLGTVSYTHL